MIVVTAEYDDCNYQLSTNRSLSYILVLPDIIKKNKHTYSQNNIAANTTFRFRTSSTSLAASRPHDELKRRRTERSFRLSCDSHTFECTHRISTQTLRSIPVASSAPNLVSCQPVLCAVRTFPIAVTFV